MTSRGRLRAESMPRTGTVVGLVAAGCLAGVGGFGVGVPAAAAGTVHVTAAAPAADPVGGQQPPGEQPWVAYQTGYHRSTGWGADGIWLIHPDGTGDHRVAAGVHDAQVLPDWSPDGTRIAFATRGGEHEPLYEHVLDTGETTQLFACEGDCLGDDEPAYSPDGRTIVFSRAFAPFVNDAPSDCSLWLGDVATREVRRLTDNHSCFREYHPRWSPDGTRLTYHRETDDAAGNPTGTAVFVLDVATGTETRITEWRDLYGDPDWSPDGDWIVMSSRPLGVFNFGSYVSNLYRVRPDGTGLQALTRYVGANKRATQPRYTPDGAHIVFTAVTPNSRELWLMPADGGTSQRITNGGIATHGTLQPSVADAVPAVRTGKGYGVQEVDQSRLVPTTLDSSFAPFDCRTTPTGPVCTGERHLDRDLGRVDDFGCSVPLYDRYVEDRYQTRYYDRDYRNYRREFRSHQVDYLAITPSGAPTATIGGDVRFTEILAVPGNDKTITITTHGVLWDVRSPGSGPLLRIVGTLVEPYNGTATFTGQRVLDGVVTRFTDAPLDDGTDASVLPFELFVSTVCRAATGTAGQP